MKEKNKKNPNKQITINKILNREDERFSEFLKRYWWIEFLALSKVVYFLSKGYYGYSFAILFLIGMLLVLWALYRIGLE